MDSLRGRIQYRADVERPRTPLIRAACHSNVGGLRRGKGGGRGRSLGRRCLGKREPVQRRLIFSIRVIVRR